MAQVTISKQAIENIADAAGLDPEDNVRTGYSGRGMFGRKCLGITGSISDLVSFTTEAVRQDEYNEASADESPEAQALHGFVRYIEDVSTDSMGLDSIFYWPDVEVSE